MYCRVYYKKCTTHSVRINVLKIVPPFPSYRWYIVYPTLKCAFIFKIQTSFNLYNVMLVLYYYANSLVVLKFMKKQNFKK